MAPEKNYNKISSTALDVAFARAYFTDMPYTWEIFKEVSNLVRVPLNLRAPSWLIRMATIFQRSNEHVAGLEIRYLSTNAMLESLGDEWAIVEIAAGISPRSLEWAGHRALYIETDLPGMIETKQELFNTIAAKKGLSDNPNHFFMQVNALDPNDWDLLGQTYFAKHDLSIAVVNEGLLSYLSREEKLRLRDNIKEFFTKYAVELSWITPDFTDRAGTNYLSKHYQKNTERKTGRAFDRFANREEVTAFLKEGGFQVDFSQDESILDKLTCIPKLHLQRERIRAILSSYQPCVARLG